MQSLRLAKINAVVDYYSTTDKWIHPSSGTHNIIAYQLSGEYDHLYGGRHHMVNEDSFIFINKSDYYEVETRFHGHCIALHFETDDPVEMNFTVIDGKKIPRLKADFTRLLNDWNRRDELSWYDCAANFYSIYARLLRGVRFSEGYIPSGKYENIVKARDHLAVNYSDPALSIESAAKIAGVSERRFGELFKLLYHMTPGRFITSLRIQSAKEMLCTPSYTVSETASSVGFSSPSYFCRVFTRETGLSPGVWRAAK